MMSSNSPYTCAMNQITNRIELQGQVIEIDADRTSSIYKRMLDWCQCDFCNNAHVTQRRYLPARQIETLRELGVDPWRPCLSEFGRNRSYDPPRYTRRLSCWFMFGTLVGGAAISKLRFDRWNWMWADTNKRCIQSFDSVLEDLEGDPDLIYVFASNALPWIYGEVASIREEFSKPCSRCGHYHRLTGYLKHGSLIPEWQGRPELSHVLRERKKRVFVEFCTHCGHMEDKVVSRTPPFRSRNEIVPIAAQDSTFTIVRSPQLAGSRSSFAESPTDTIIE